VFSAGVVSFVAAGLSAVVCVEGDGFIVSAVESAVVAAADCGATAGFGAVTPECK
jgi:hypothetical protein